MSDILDKWSDVFADNDEPDEMSWENHDCNCDCNPPKPTPKPPRKYSRTNPVVNRPYSDKPVPPPPPCESYVYDGDIPNPVPNTYFDPGHCPKPCPPPPHPCPPSPHPCPPPPSGDCKFVTRHELSKVLTNIANADIYIDLSTNGTTASVGGIKKGTKYRKLTLAKLVEDMLYSNTAFDDEDYKCELPDGRTVLNSIVKFPMGDLNVGDSLKGMTISEIIEAAFCGKNKWGTYKWISAPTPVVAGTTTLDADTLFQDLVADYRNTNTYELHVVGPDTGIDEYEYDYTEIIAQKDNPTQRTNVTVEGVPSDTKWSYNPESKKITLHTSTNIASNILVVLLRR